MSMKKYISPILSIILGILTFGMYGAPFMGVTSVLGSAQAKSAYECIRFDSNDPASLTAFSVFSVIILVLAGCLIVSGIFMILQNTKVIKSKSIAKLNTILLWATALIAIATMICYVVFYSDKSGSASIFGTEVASTTIGVTTIVNAAAAVVFAVIDLFTAKFCVSSKKKKK